MINRRNLIKSSFAAGALIGVGSIPAKAEQYYVSYVGRIGIIDFLSGKINKIQIGNHLNKIADKITANTKSIMVSDLITEINEFIIRTDPDTAKKSFYTVEYVEGNNDLNYIQIHLYNKKKLIQIFHFSYHTSND